MKQILLVLFFFFLFPNRALAQTDWVITNFKSDIAVQTDGIVSVNEIIDVNFNNLKKHGIYRDIPVVYQDADGQKTYTKIDVTSVLQDNQKAEYKLIKDVNNLRIRIGDPDQTINGIHAYQINYIATGVLRSFADHDELYWNATGNDWEADIEKASSTVHIPKNALTKTACFEGYTGYTTTCSITEQTATGVTFTATRNLPPTQGLTIVTGFTKGTVPILTVPPPKKISDDLFTTLSLTSFLFALLGSIILAVWLWSRNGRDFWFRVPHMLDPTAKAETKPIGAHEQIVVEFEPPEGLRPAEIGVLMDQKADTLDVTATIIDLANRGFLTIKELEKKWLLGSIDYELHRTDKPQVKLLEYESWLLKRLFATGDTITMSSLKTTFYDDLADVKKKLYQDMMDKKLFIESPESTRAKYAGLGVGILLLGIILIIVGFATIIEPFVTFGVGAILSSIVWFVMSRSMARRSAIGHDLYQRTKGYILFINGAEKYRQQFYEKKNMFNEILPYAIVFGLTGKFAKAMKDMGVTPNQPSWYSGTHTFTPILFASNIDSFSKSLSSAIAATPSSSGGFSGGSSGGGFGGGGGGSW